MDGSIVGRRGAVALAGAGIVSLVLPDAARASSGDGDDGATALLQNGDFAAGTTGWTSSRGFAAYSYTFANQPTVHEGELIFSYVLATVSQAVPVVPTGVERFTASCSVAGTFNRSIEDDFSLTAVFLDGGGATVASVTTGTIPLDGSARTLEVSLTNAAPGFASIASCRVELTGIDDGFWNGHHGPRVAWVDLAAVAQA